MTRSGATNRVRIIGGEHRGRILHFPDAAGLRPTADRIRETLFNWLQFQIPGSRCLDLFAGSGVLGFEAASRGAAHVTMVESARKVFAMLQKNRELLQFEKRISLVNRDAMQWLDGCSEQFDVVFLDPPFTNQLLQPAIDRLAGSQALAPGARLYIEQDTHDSPPVLPQGWEMVREKTAGQVRYMLVETLP